MKKILLLCLITTGFTKSFSQPDTLRGKFVRGIYESADFINGDFMKINEVLATNGFPTLKNTYGGVAIGVTSRPADRDSYFSGKFFFYSSSPPVNYTQPKNATVTYWGLHHEQHLDLVQNRNWRIGPDYGFGVGFFKLKISERLITHNSFASSLSSFPARAYEERQYHTFTYFATVGGSVEKKMRISAIVLYLGVGAGYRFSTKATLYEAYQTYDSYHSARLSGTEFNIKIRMEVDAIRAAKQAKLPYRKFY
jgi:hypothetical protein